jgi:hypothetical protein
MELEDVVQEGLGSMVSTEGRMVPHVCWELGWGGHWPHRAGGAGGYRAHQQWRRSCRCGWYFEYSRWHIALWVKADQIVASRMQADVFVGMYA